MEKRRVWSPLRQAHGFSLSGCARCNVSGFSLPAWVLPTHPAAVSGGMIYKTQLSDLVIPSLRID